MEKLGIDYFENLWQDSVPKDGMRHTKETWDKIAETWMGDTPEVAAKKQQMVEEIAAYLKTKGALRSDFDVIDIGCGSGNYAVEFAKTARTVTASDISGKMLEYVQSAASSKGLKNIELLETDFSAFEPEENNCVSKYDLVFTSLTPAMSGVESIYKVNKMSRNFCFNISFVYRKDSIRNGLLKNVFNKTPDNNWGNSSPYCLFNILWQMGLHPEMTYYDECVESECELSMAFAKDCAKTVIRDKEPSQDTITRVYAYLESIARDGRVKRETKSLFALTLWKTEEK